MKNILVLALLLFIVSCSQNDSPSDIAPQCTKSSDCILPSEYAIQSNCPFTTACIKSECNVACPLANEKAEAATQSFTVSCKKDSDCDCKERGERTLQCSCADNRCVSIEG